jgi:hypothetical protein
MSSCWDVMNVGRECSRNCRVGMKPPEVYLHQVANYNIVPSYTSITKTWRGEGMLGIQTA